MKSERHRGKQKDPDKMDSVEKKGAKTFRRGRAIAFLERLNTKRDTLKKQLETPELQTIHPHLVGELKAVEMIRDEFIQLFELHEVEENQTEEAE